MTTDFTAVVDLKDIQAFRLECRAYGTSVSVDPRRWKHQMERCPNCLVPWRDQPKTADAAIDMFIRGLQQLVAQSRATPPTLPYRVRIELAHQQSLQDVDDLYSPFDESSNT